MNNLRTMIQDELKQALAGLIPLPAMETTPITDIVQPAPTILLAVISPIVALAPGAATPPITLIVVGDPLANNNNAEGQPMNAARNVPNVEENLEEIKNYMIEKAKR